MRVYIAGPISKGNHAKNMRVAIFAADAVFKHGHYPYVPHLDFLWEVVAPNAYEDRLRLDHEWLKVCDALIRLAGDSPGADREVKWAEEIGIPIYWGVEQFLDKVPRVWA